MISSSATRINYAKKVVHDIRELIDELNGLPKMGRMVPELSEEGVTELLLYSYRIIYEIKDKEIFVLTVIIQSGSHRIGDAGMVERRGFRSSMAA